MLHEDVTTIMGHRIRGLLVEPQADKDDALARNDATSGDEDTVLRGCENPFQATGGLNVLEARSAAR